MPLNYDIEYPKLVQVAAERKREIERLESRLCTASNTIGMQKYEIERLEAEVSKWKYVAADYEISCTQQHVDRLEARVAELEGERKRDCCEFFRWFWNAPGTNAEQGYDEWKALKD